MVNIGKNTIYRSYGLGMTHMFCGPGMNLNKELSEPIVFKELSLTLAVSLGGFPTVPIIVTIVNCGPCIIIFLAALRVFCGFEASCRRLSNVTINCQE